MKGDMPKALRDALKRAYDAVKDSPEVREYMRSRGRRSLDTMTPEQRSARAQKAGLTGGKKSAASLTPEQRTARAKKAAAARIAKRKNAK